jgi:hypothetical protein
MSGNVGRRSALDETVRCSWGADGGANVVERRSVKDRDALSFIGGARLGADNKAFLDVGDLGESSDERDNGIVSGDMSVARISSSAERCLFLRAGHTYSMMRRPTLAST